MDWREKFENLRKKHARVVKEKQRPLPTPVTIFQPEPINQADLRMKNFKEMQGRLARNKSIVPNLIAQSRIFKPSFRGKRLFYQDWTLLDTLNIDNKKIEIEMQFYQLNQFDLTIYLGLIKFADPKDLIARFSGREFLNYIKRPTTGKYYKILDNVIDRLGGTRIGIHVQGEFEGKQKKYRYRDSLAPRDWAEENNNLHAVQLSSALMAFFGIENWSLINMEQRIALKHEWAQAFHAYLSTHTCPQNGLWWKKEILWQTWGREYQDQKNFLKLFKRRVLKPLYEIGFLTKIDEKKSAIGLWWKK